MAASDDEGRKAFIRANTILRAPPIVPEVQLHLASEVMNLWTQTEALSAAHAAGVSNLPPPYWAFAWPGGQAVARFILDRADEFAGKSVLDFGAGSGLVASRRAETPTWCGYRPRRAYAATRGGRRRETTFETPLPAMDTP